MEMQELSLEKFEEASEIVKKVTQETKPVSYTHLRKVWTSKGWKIILTVSNTECRPTVVSESALSA